MTSENKIEELKLELNEAREEIKFLKGKYENQVDDLKNEVGFLKEKLMAQQDMLKQAINYADKLGKEMKSLKKKINSGDFQSIH